MNEIEFILNNLQIINFVGRVLHCKLQIEKYEYFIDYKFGWTRTALQSRFMLEIMNSKL